MASKSTQTLMTIAALTEGYTDMMHKQGASDPQFDAIRDDIKTASDRCMRVLRAEPNGPLNDRERDRVGKRLDAFHEKTKFYRGTEATTAISMLICMISDALVRIKPGPKREAFESLFHAVENLMTWADPEWVYSGDDGYRAATIFESLSI